MSSKKLPKPRFPMQHRDMRSLSACPRVLFREPKHRGLPLVEFPKSLDNQNLRLSAAILAGGKNSRMKGKDKAFLLFDGQPLIQRTISILQSLFTEIFIVTNSPRSYKQYANDAIIIEDSIKEIGPLGGIYAALSQTKRKAVFFVACDMPLLHNGIIAQQIREFEKMDVDVFIPKVGDRLEPLHGIYRQRISEKLLLFLQKSQGHSIREFLKKVGTEYWKLADTVANRKYFTNVNTPEELKKLLGRSYVTG
jgi:molybdenum cofactor guanylyltransferase